MVSFTKYKRFANLSWKQNDKQPKTLPTGVPIPEGMSGVNLSTGTTYRWNSKKNKWIKEVK